MSSRLTFPSSLPRTCGRHPSRRRCASAVRELAAILTALVLGACAHGPEAEPVAPIEPPAAPESGAASEEEVGAGAQAPDDTAADTASTSPPAETGEPEPPPPTSGDDLDADIAALAETAKGAELDPEPSQREIVYRVTPKGLVIEIDGFHLRPSAKPFKDANGAYGIELSVTAESFDGRQYWVNKPKEGPLSIAGKIESKEGKPARFRDQREGKGEELVHASEPRTFRQRWPGRGQPKLWWGQTLTLEVGLWGVRAEAGRERPVRRLFVVKMVAGNKPQAIVSPPTLDWGS